jgi:hypothetical protein
MKYTLNIIDTEEKFKEKFGSDPQWIISVPTRKQKSPTQKSVTNNPQPAKGSGKT